MSVSSGFPTITGPAGGAIVDQASLQDALASAGALPAQVTEWWLRTSRPVALAGLPAGTTITDRAVMAASLLASPLAAAPQLAMLAIAAAAVILAVAGFFVSAATARERAHDMALLAALGATKGQLTRLLCLEQAVISVPAALAGLLLGGLLARLVIPAVSITAAGTPPVPPVLVQTPWAVPCAVALVMAAGPVLLAAAARRPPLSGGQAHPRRGHDMRRAGRVVRLVTGPAGLGPVVALAVIAALAAFLATAGPRESARLQNQALRQTLAANPGFGIFASADSTVSSPQRQLTAGQLQQASNVISSAFRPPMVSPRASRWSGIASPQSVVSRPVPRAVLVSPPQFETDYFGPLAGNVKVISGTLPRTATIASKAVVMQAAVTAATAARFGLRVGSQLRLQPPQGTPLILKVTALVRPVNPATSFWVYDPTVAAPTVVQGSWLGGALIGPGELAAFPAVYPRGLLRVAWSFPLDTSALTAAQEPAMVAAMTTVAGGPVGGQAMQVSGAPLSATPTLYPGGLGTLTTFAAEQAAAGAINSLLTDGLFAVALILLLACALVVSDAYDGEVSLILARGGSIQQVALRLLRRSALAAGPAIVVSTVAGLAATPGGGSPHIWLIAAVAVTALGAPPLITMWRHRGSRPVASGEQRDDLVIPRHSRRRLVIEATVLIAIAGAVAALRVRGASSTSSGDPYVSSAPVLVAVAAGLIAARIYPVPLRMLLRVTSPRRAPVGFLGIARAARSRSAALLPGLALVVALAVIALGGALRAAVDRGQVAASWQQVGADAVIRTEGSVQEAGPAAQRAIAAVPGVTHTAAVYLVAPGDPQDANLLTGIANSAAAGVLIVNPEQYARLTAATPFPAFPAGLLARHGTGTVVPVVASPEVAAMLKKGSQPACLWQQPADDTAGRDHDTHAGPARRRAVRHSALLGAVHAEGHRPAERPAAHRLWHQHG